MTRSLFDPARAIRGGSWFSLARFVHAARRDIGGPSLRLRTLGLRLLRRAS